MMNAANELANGNGREQLQGVASPGTLESRPGLLPADVSAGSPTPSGTGAHQSQVIGAHQKALHINLDKASYGTFAEIGAGQEVARWFFRVVGAAGTIAKSISAYDMAVSDEIYGK